jgi:hypothetical protein
MCCLYLQGAWGINWGIEKCQLCRIIVPGKRKGKGLPNQGDVGTNYVTFRAALYLTSALDVGGCSTPRPGRFTPGIVRVCIVYEVGWATGLIWTDAENFNAAGI